MIKRIKGDVTKIDFQGPYIIPHVVNSRGQMGSGVALGLYRKWKAVKKDYTMWYLNHSYHDYRLIDAVPFDLGEVQFIQVEPNIIVANMVAQKFGYLLDDNGEEIPPIRIWALEECIMKVKKFLTTTGFADTIYAPKFGSMRAGGDFEGQILPLIEKYWGGFTVNICEYDEGSIRRVV
jgi:hypothetical protein